METGLYINPATKNNNDADTKTTDLLLTIVFFRSIKLLEKNESK